MKSPVPLLLLIAFLALAAGCSSGPEDPGATPPQVTVLPPTLPEEVYTPAPPYTDLTQLTLTPAEVPFTIVKKDGGVSVLTGDRSTFTSGATRGYQVFYANASTDLPFSSGLRQQIVEYSPGNAPTAYRDELAFIQKNIGVNYRIVPYPDLAIGDESYGFTAINITGTAVENPSSFIIFRKGDVIESISLKYPSAEIWTTAGIARKAASKIPGTGARTPTRTPNPSLQPGVDLVTLLVATAGPAGTVTRLSFGLKLHDGNPPVDMSRMKFHVYEDITRDSTRILGSGDQGVQIRWQKSPGHKDPLLGPDDIAIVDLDLDLLGFTQPPGTVNHGMFVYASDPASPTLGFRWCRDLPAILVPGTGYVCMNPG
jgi:hypothetical protein